MFPQERLDGNRIFGNKLFFPHQFGTSSEKLSVFCRQVFGRVVKTAYYVPRGNFYENQFIQKLTSFCRFWTLSEKLSALLRKIRSLHSNTLTKANFRINYKIESFGDIERIRFGLLLHSFWAGCQNCKLRLKMNLLMKKSFFSRIFFFLLNFGPRANKLRPFGKFFLGIFVKTAFCVSKRFFSENSIRFYEIFVLFGTLSEKFWHFVEKKSVRLSEFHSRCQ